MKLKNFAQATAITFALLFSLNSCKENEVVPEKQKSDFSGARVEAVSVTLPLYGNYTASSDATKWYNTIGSPAHIAYSTFDDSNAYDINLQGDRDKGLPVLSPFAGTVTKLGTTFPGTTAGGTYGAVLIDIGSGNYVGFMHLTGIKVKDGDKVTAGQLIGNIGSTGVTNNHLHFSYYTAESTTDSKTKKVTTVLRSKSVSFSDRTFTLPLTWKDSKVVLKPNVSSQITGSVPFGDKGNIESSTYFSNTLWSADDVKIAKVDGNGKVTGVKKGSTTIRLKFSGQEFTFPVNVN
jgi:biotin carboxyl carrier protein